MQFDLTFAHSWAWVDLVANRNIGSDVTLLTIGDSWTWGDELGSACGLCESAFSDTDYRMSKVFGNLLADKLNANWVQTALPGASWNWIVDELERTLPQLVTQTKKVIVVLGFSDHGRELGDEHLPIMKLWRDGFTEHVPLKTILTEVETEYYRRISNILDKYPTAKCIAGPVFSSHLTQQPYHTDKQWVDLLFDYELEPCYSYTSGIWAIDQYLQKYNLRTLEYKEDICNNWFPAMGKRQTEMDANPLLFDRWHPKEAGHQIWADYLYEHINENSNTYLW